MHSDEILAILGGSPVVDIPHPHMCWPLIEPGDEQAVVTQLHAGISIYGREGAIRDFEDAFLSYVNRSGGGQARFALATNNGTAALAAAYFGCSLGEGDEVLVPAYAFHASASPMLLFQAVPVFCDIDQLTGNINLDDARRRVTIRTRAIVVTHLWGHPADMDGIKALCEQYGLACIEDCSHAHGATYRGQQVGTFGDVACFSLQATKMLPAGEGGILITDSEEIYERANMFADSRRRLYQEVRSSRYQPFLATGLGLKFRMHPLAAALAQSQLRSLAQRIEWRAEQLDHLTALLQDVPGVTPPHTAPHVTRGAFYGYECLLDVDTMAEERDLFVEALCAEGLEAERTDLPLLHRLALFTWQTTASGATLPAAESRGDRAFHLPSFTLPDARPLVEQYAAGVRKVALNFAELKRWYAPNLAQLNSAKT